MCGSKSTGMRAQEHLSRYHTAPAEIKNITTCHCMTMLSSPAKDVLNWRLIVTDYCNRSHTPSIY